MAYSYNSYIADGATTQFAAPDYIDEAHVHVYIDGVEDTTYTWISSGIIETSSTPADGAIVLVQRETPVADPLVVFSAPSVLRPENLNTAILQQLYLYQEGVDQVPLKFDTVEDAYSAENERITNVANPTQADDAVSKGYADATYEPKDSTILKTGDLTGTGTAETPARSDHTHTGVYQPYNEDILKVEDLVGTGVAETPARSDHHHDSVYSFAGHTHDSLYLARDNTGEFNPVGDYNPATKKYVDDNIISGGVTDHGALNGLADDDHPHYLNETRGDMRYALSGHNHDGVYSSTAHDHDADYATLGHNHDADYSDITHNHVSRDEGTHSSGACDLSTGNVFSITVSGALSISLTNAPSGETSFALLKITNGGSATVSWPIGIKWPGGTAPSLTASGLDLVVLMLDSSGTYYGTFSLDVK